MLTPEPDSYRLTVRTGLTGTYRLHVQNTMNVMFSAGRVNLRANQTLFKPFTHWIHLKKRCANWSPLKKTTVLRAGELNFLLLVLTHGGGVRFNLNIAFQKKKKSRNDIYSFFTCSSEAGSRNCSQKKKKKLTREFLQGSLIFPHTHIWSFQTLIKPIMGICFHFFSNDSVQNKQFRFIVTFKTKSEYQWKQTDQTWLSGKHYGWII